MALTLDDLLERVAVRPPVEAEVPRIGKVWFRYPTIEEWHDITIAHRKVGDNLAPVELMARTVAMVLCNEDGKPVMTAEDARQLHGGDPTAVMNLYKKAVAVAFPIGEPEIDAAEGN